MKPLFGVIFSLVLLATMAAPSVVFADAISDAQNQLEDTADSVGLSTSATVPGIVGGVIAAFLGVLGTLFLCLILYGGYIWLTAAGDSSKVDKAKDLIRNAIIGLMIVLGAYILTNFIISSLVQSAA